MDLPDSPSSAFIRSNRNGAPGFTIHQVRTLPIASRSVRLLAGSGTSSHREPAALAGVADGVLVRIDAARAWDLPLPPWHFSPDPQVHVAVSPERGKPRRRDVKGHRFDIPGDHIAQLPVGQVTTPARTWVDCAAEIPREYVVAMGDAILHRQLADVTEMRAMLHWAYRRRGTAIARRALPLLDGRAESPGESVTRLQILDAGIPCPIANYVLESHGEFLGRLDLAWPEFKVCVEYDGVIHLGEDHRRKDARRRNRIQDEGWVVIVVTADDVRQPFAYLALLRRALGRRGWVNPRLRAS